VPPAHSSASAAGRTESPSERASRTPSFKAHLRQRWEQGCTNAAELYRQITALGFTGSYGLVRDFLEQYRSSPAPIAPAPPTVRAVTGWLTRHPDRLIEDEQLQLKAILERCPELAAGAGHIRWFGEMLTRLRGQDLPAWISAVRADNLPGLASFAAGLEADLDAVSCGLTTRWSSGSVEGRVNHIKMLKRQMFGRAGLPLLRKRVLLTASSLRSSTIRAVRCPGGSEADALANLHDGDRVAIRIGDGGEQDLVGGDLIQLNRGSAPRGEVLEGPAGVDNPQGDQGSTRPLGIEHELDDPAGRVPLGQP
jgi:hypothetical protein